MRSFCRRAGLIAGIAVLVGAQALAVSLEHFSLGKMIRNADRIFRGTVVQVTTGSKELGGGHIPTITYTLRVDEAFKGTFDELKGEQFAELQMIGKLPPLKVGNATRLSAVQDMPQLELGREYLLFASPPSRAGLSAPIGLGQGCFEILEKEGATQAVNAYNNVGLLSGPGRDQTTRSGQPLPSSGPVSYSLLADQIRSVMSR